MPPRPSGAVPAPRDDVTAVLLSLGEPTTARALASVAAQAAGGVVVVRDTTPFHRALNAGAAQVRTPFFLQVDADMVPDPTCVADLRACMADRVGVVIGLLHDPLLGRIGGIKLFRTACFALERFPDSISPDTDFGTALERHDWRTVYALKPAPGGAETAHVFGEHRPDYTPLYTFRKFLLQGARHRHRRAARGIRALCQRLRDSPHAAAPYALVGTAHGIFLAGERDLLVPFDHTSEFARLERFLAAPDGDAALPDAVRRVATLDPPSAWRLGCRLGADLHARRAPRAFMAALHHLVDTGGVLEWLAMVGLCHGVFADDLDEDRAGDEFALVNRLLPRPYRAP